MKTLYPYIKILSKSVNNYYFYLFVIIISMLFVPVSELLGEAVYNTPFVFERAYLTFLGMFGILIFSINVYTQKKIKVAYTSLLLILYLLFYSRYTKIESYFYFFSIAIFLLPLIVYVKQSKISIVEAFYIFMIALATLSLVFTKYMFGRNLFQLEWHREELFHYFSYFFLFYAATKINIRKHWHYIFWCFIAILVLHNFFGVLQLFGFRLSLSYNNQEMHEQLRCIYGLTSNCNFYAGLATIFTALACSEYMLSKSKNNTFRRIFIITISAFCAICSGTRLGILGVLVSIFLSFAIVFYVRFFYESKFLQKYQFFKSINHAIDRNCYKKFFVILCCISFSIAMICLFFPHLLLPSFSEFFKDFNTIANVGNTNAKIHEIGSFRGQVWQFSIEYLLNVNFLTGTGIGNFQDVFYSNPNRYLSPQIVNFAHNEYLHIFATQGFVAFVTYMSLFGLCICRALIAISHSSNLSFIKNKIIILFVLLAYMCQAFFNCNIFETYFNFWILLGLAYSYDKR